MFGECNGNERGTNLLGEARGRRLGLAGATAVSLLLAASCSAEDPIAASSKVGAMGEGNESAAGSSGSGAKPGGVSSGAGFGSGGAGSLGKGGSGSGLGGSGAAVGSASASGGLGGSSAAGPIFGETGGALGFAGMPATGAAGSGGAGVVMTPMLPATECMPGERRCDPTGKAAQICSAAGTWEGGDCQFLCSDGACSGVCLPGSRKCDGQQPERCDDAGQWVADGGACMAQCEQGACTGACKNGATQCASTSALKLCMNGQWGPEMACEFACVDQMCGGVCDPQTTRCASGTELETCNSSGQWGERKSCDFVCNNGTCGGQCSPGQMRCMNNQQDRCNAQGQWEKAQSCQFVCENNACGGECRPGETRCKSNTTSQVCNARGQWEDKACSSNACVNGACHSCQPDALKCENSTQIRECNDNGEWGSPQECKNQACSDNRCVGSCSPNQAPTCKALGHHTITCDASGKLKETECVNQGCQNGKCGDFKKYVFVTSETYNGDLGGLSGADSKCNALAKAGGMPGTYKAFLADTNNDINARFSFAGGPIVQKRPSGDQIIADDWNQVLNGSIKANLDRDERGNSAPFGVLQPQNDETEDFCGGSGITAFVWGNVTSGGKIKDTVNHCGNWTKENFAGAMFGIRTDPQGWKYSCRQGKDSDTSGPSYCRSKAPLICFQQ